MSDPTDERLEPAADLTAAGEDDEADALVGAELAVDPLLAD